MNQKRWLLRVQMNRCFYCSRPLRYGTATFDHVQPLAQGGANTTENLVVCCYHCNQCKGGRTIEEWVSDLVRSKRLWDMHTKLGRQLPKRDPT